MSYKEAERQRRDKKLSKRMNNPVDDLNINYHIFLINHHVSRKSKKKKINGDEVADSAKYLPLQG